jgi:hypothetical protein
MNTTTISFAELENLINSLAGTNGSALRDYIELDPTAPVIRLHIKPEVTVEGIPPGYDVDQQLNNVLQDLLLVNPEQPEEEDTDREVLLPSDSLEIPRALETIKIVAEGDSWFRLPEIPGIFLLPRMFPKATASQLQRRPGFNVKNIAHWGDTLNQMYQRKEYLNAIDSFQPQYFLLSAGGNDLQINRKRSFQHV